METKTIRFEHTGIYEDDDVFMEIFYLFSKTKNRDMTEDTTWWWRPLKSFTVQINIIEDENN